MSGVGSTNAMKKGSANNPFLAYSEADMQGFLNSAYTGCIVKYTGSSTKKGIQDVLPLDSAKSLGDAQNLVVNLYWAINNDSDYGEVAHPAGGTIRENPWHITVVNKTTGKTQYIQEVKVDTTNKKFVDTSKTGDLAWLLSDWYLSSLNDSLSFRDSLTKNVTVLECEKDKSKSGYDLLTYWPLEKGWQKSCFNTEGKILLWGYGDTVELSCPVVYYYNRGPFWVEPYVVNELYKVVYGDGQYYFEEFYHINDDVTTAIVEDVAPGKTFYDFTGTKQTGTGTKINPYLATDLDTFKSFPIGSFIKWLGPNKTVIDTTTGQTLIQGEVYRAVEDGDVFQYVILPTLTNEATAEDVAAGKEFINGNGQKIVGTKLFIGSFDKTSWFDIRNIVLSGKASDYWKVGDTKTITSKSGRIYNIRLTDLQTNRYTYSDGSGSSKAVFEFVECYALNNESLWPMNVIVTNGGGWAASEMRSQTMPIILADLPDDMVEAMSQVKVLSGTGDGSTSGTSSSDNKLFLPSETEMLSRAQYSIGLEESPLGQFDYYKANGIASARIKNRPGESMALGYWVRSPRKDNLGDFMCINNYGAIQTRQSDNRTCISPIFTI